MDAETLKLIEMILRQNQEMLDINRIIIETLCPIEMSTFGDPDDDPTIQ